MCIRTLEKSGVLGVLGVPESLKASNDEAYSEGNTKRKSQNTKAQEDERCSPNSSPNLHQPDPERAPPPLFAAGMGGDTGRGADEVDPFLVVSTRRWVGVPGDSGVEWRWDPSAEDDLDDLFTRISDGTSTHLDNELFDACLLDRFISRVYAGQPVERWILLWLADTFAKMLLGGAWNDEIRLPGYPATEIRPWREQRDLEIFCAVSNAVKSQTLSVTVAIESVARDFSVSYETARAAYYGWKGKLSKKDGKA